MRTVNGTEKDQTVGTRKALSATKSQKRISRILDAAGRREYVGDVKKL